MHKVLVGYIQDGKHSGIDKYLLGFCEVASKMGVTLDFLTSEFSPEMNERLAEMGFGLFEVPSLKNPVAQYKAVRQLIREGGYDGVYLNISESFNCMALMAAKKEGVPTRIVHSHSSAVDRANKYSRALRTLLNRLFKGYVTKKATRRLACSSVAGQWMFNGEFEMIFNAIDSGRFGFDPVIREQKRIDLGLTEDKKVFIHIGNFCYQKNQFFLMEIMGEIISKDSDAILLSVGCGYDFDAVKDYAQQLGIAAQIEFLGVRDDIPALLNAADVMLLPSRFEGLPIVAVEAQFSGLPCIMAYTVTKEAAITEKAVFVPLGDASKWAEAALSSAQKREAAVFLEGATDKFDLNNSQKQLEDILRS